MVVNDVSVCFSVVFYEILGQIGNSVSIYRTQAGVCVCGECICGGLFGERFSHTPTYLLLYFPTMVVVVFSSFVFESIVRNLFARHCCVVVDD